MHRGERRLRIHTVIWCMVLTLVVVIADTPKLDLLRPAEHWLYDRRARYCQFFAPVPTDKLVHLDLDDEGLEDIARDYGSFPWPRSVMADLLDEIRGAGPK